MYRAACLVALVAFMAMGVSAYGLTNYFPNEGKGYGYTAPSYGSNSYTPKFHFGPLDSFTTPICQNESIPLTPAILKQYKKISYAASISLHDECESLISAPLYADVIDLKCTVAGGPFFVTGCITPDDFEIDYDTNDTVVAVFSGFCKCGTGPKIPVLTAVSNTNEPPFCTT